MSLCAPHTHPTCPNAIMHASMHLYKPLNVPTLCFPKSLYYIHSYMSLHTSKYPTLCPLWMPFHTATYLYTPVCTSMCLYLPLPYTPLCIPVHLNPTHPCVLLFAPTCPMHPYVLLHAYVSLYTSVCPYGPAHTPTYLYAPLYAPMQLSTPLHAPVLCMPFKFSDWLRLSTTANQITWINQPNLHKILIFPHHPFKKVSAHPKKKMK